MSLALLLMASMLLPLSMLFLAPMAGTGVSPVVGPTVTGVHALVLVHAVTGTHGCSRFSSEVGLTVTACVHAVAGAHDVAGVSIVGPLLLASMLLLMFMLLLAPLAVAGVDFVVGPSVTGGP